LQKKPYEPYDSVVGLGPYTGSLMDNLVSKKIYKNTFAIHIGGAKHKSHISFGGIHAEYKLNDKVTTNYVMTNNASVW